MKDTTIDDICIWKKLSLDPNSTTFEIVKDEGIKHPLYKCIICDDGFKYNPFCQNYKSLAYLEGNENKEKRRI